MIKAFTIDGAKKEALKELGRVLLMAIVSFVIAQLDMVENKTEFIIVLIALLRTIDKYMHEKGKEPGNEKLLTGLTRF